MRSIFFYKIFFRRFNLKENYSLLKKEKKKSDLIQKKFSTSESYQPFFPQMQLQTGVRISRQRHDQERSDETSRGRERKSR